MSDWLVDGLLEKKSVSLFVGESSVGKTLLLLDLAYSVATGQKWLKHYDCLKGPVVFIAGESSLSKLEGRVIGINKGRDRDPKWYGQNGAKILSLIAQRDSDNPCDTFPLSSAIWKSKVESMLDSTPEGMKPVLWILDPLIALAENPDAEESRSIMKWCFNLADKTNGHVIIAHHLRKGKGGGQESQADRIRGDSALRGLADTIFYLTKGANNSKMAHVYLNKARDGEAPGEEHPLFHVLRNFRELSKVDFYDTLHGYNVGNIGEANPTAIYDIDLQYIPYVEDAEEKYLDTVEGPSEAPQETKPLNAYQETLKDLLTEEEPGEAQETVSLNEVPAPVDYDDTVVGTEPKKKKDLRLKGKPVKAPENGMDEVGELIVEILKWAEDGESLTAYQLWDEMKRRALGVGHGRLQNRIDAMIEAGILELTGKSEKGASVYQVAS